MRTRAPSTRDLSKGAVAASTGTTGCAIRVACQASASGADAKLASAAVAPRSRPGRTERIVHTERTVPAGAGKALRAGIAVDRVRLGRASRALELFPIVIVTRLR